MDRYDESVEVRSVHDGDTIRLEDGRKVRLIGIDTPELARKNVAEQPYAREAKNALNTLIEENGNKIHLVYDEEKLDRYGRLLAHLFLEDGTNIQAQLIRDGLAIALTVPPNTGFTRCYGELAESSRQSGRNIWSHKRWKPLQVRSVNPKSKGFHIIEGVIENVNITAKGVWFNIEDKVFVQIRKKDRSYFSDDYLTCLEGSRVQISGWLHPKTTVAYMSLRHPSAVKVLDEDGC